MTRRGVIPLPAYLPVTTFGDRYPLDELVRPYLPRLAAGVMVSYGHLPEREAELDPGLPLLLDSGGFRGLSASATVEEVLGQGVLVLPDERVSPAEVLERQEAIADVGFTLDFPIPRSAERGEAERRLALTVANALWAIANRRRRDLLLYACVQGWDVESVRRCARAYVGQGFDGVALGGLVPRARDRAMVDAMVDAVHQTLPDLPLHVLGVGQPAGAARLFARGVASVDSSAYVRLAVDGKSWGGQVVVIDPSPIERLQIALCNLATATGQSLPLSAAPSFLSRHLRGP